MRIRQIKPEFFTDKALAGLSADARLFYIGLWMEADDDGYIKWVPDQIAARLYPYRTVAARERFVRVAAVQLADTGHIVMLPCEKHVTVPGLPKHQVVASTRRVVRTHGEHTAQCLSNGAPSPPMEIQEGTERNGKVGNGTEDRAHAHESTIDELRGIIADDTSTAPAKKAARKALERLGITTGEAT